MKTQKTVVLLSVLALVLSACGQRGVSKVEAPAGEPTEGGYAYTDTTMPTDAIAEQPAVGVALGAPAELRLTGSGAGELDLQGGVPVANERLVLKSADISLVVENPLEQMDAIIRLAEGMGGFIVTSNLHEVQTHDGDKVKNATLTIRVPSARFGAVLSQLEGSALEVQHKTISGQDVTQAYTDLQSRLRNLEEAAAQLRLIMSEAHKTEEVLTVYYQLVQVTEQIEVLKGQIQYYEEASAFGSISIQLISAASLVQPPVVIAGWSPEGEAREAVAALLEVLQGLAKAGIWVAVYVLPQVLMFGLPLWLLARWLKRTFAEKPGATAS